MTSPSQTGCATPSCFSRCCSASPYRPSLVSLIISSLHILPEPQAPIPLELVSPDKDYPAKEQGVQLLKMMEVVTFSTSLDIPLLGVGVSVNYSHVSNGVKALRLSRSDFDALIRFVGDLPYSPDAMVLQIQAVLIAFSLRFS